MTREWTQKHIEELIKGWWDEHKGELSGGGGSDTQLSFDAWISFTAKAHPTTLRWACFSRNGNVTLTSTVFEDEETPAVMINTLQVANYVTSGDFIDGNGIAYVLNAGGGSAFGIDATLRNARNEIVRDDLGLLITRYISTDTSRLFQPTGTVTMNGRDTALTFSIDYQHPMYGTGTVAHTKDAYGVSLSSTAQMAPLLRVSDPSTLTGEISPVFVWPSYGVIVTGGY